MLLRIFWVPKQLQELGTSLIGSWPQLGIKKAQSEDKADLGTRPQDEAFNSTWLEAKGQQKVLSQGSGVQQAASPRPQLSRTVFVSVSGCGRGSCSASPISQGD